MGNLFTKIVLTGGPCSGKTSALPIIKNDLINHGYNVISVGESATEVIESGLHPKDACIDNFSFEKLVFKHQFNKELLYENSVNMLKNDNPSIILYDRGIIDCKVYLHSNDFYMLLNEFNLSESDIKNKYDLVIHLKSVAVDREDYYTLENNKSRIEKDVIEARLSDERTLNAWIGHKNLKVVENFPTFNQKVSVILNNIYEYLLNTKSKSLC